MFASILMLNYFFYYKIKKNLFTLYLLSYCLLSYIQEKFNNQLYPFYFIQFFNFSLFVIAFYLDILFGFFSRP